MGVYCQNFKYKSNAPRVWEELMLINEREIIDGLYVYDPSQDIYTAENGAATITILEKESPCKLKYFIKNVKSSCYMEFSITETPDGIAEVFARTELESRNSFLNALTSTYAKKMTEDVMHQLKRELAND